MNLRSSVLPAQSAFVKPYLRRIYAIGIYRQILRRNYFRR